MQYRSYKNGVSNIHFKLFFILKVFFYDKSFCVLCFFCTFASGKPIEVSVYITFRLKVSKI